MIIDFSALGKFETKSGENAKSIYSWVDLCMSLLGYKAGYLSSTLNIMRELGGAGRRNRTDRSNVNYIDLMLRVKLCSCNFLLPTSLARLVVGRASLVV